ncbi:MAG: hydrolase TatD [Pirellula sp.]|nr:hydrolase TatD [Pirellula sp.]
MIDTHCHLDQDEFQADLDEVVARAVAAGVESLVCVAVTASSSENIVRNIASRPGCFAAVGIHPNYTHEAKPGDWARVEALVDAPCVVALGETGLDRHWNYAPFELQQDYFARHLELSRRTGLPFIVHLRDCEADVMAMLEDAAKHGPLTGVMHSFTCSPETAARCVELGLYISFAGMATFKKSDDIRRTAASVPDDRILIETDSPYLSPQPLRGKRNEPANIVHTAKVLADVRGTPLEQFAAQTTANARRLFSRMT